MPINVYIVVQVHSTMSLTSSGGSRDITGRFGESRSISASKARPMDHRNGNHQPYRTKRSKYAVVCLGGMPTTTNHCKLARKPRTPPLSGYADKISLKMAVWAATQDSFHGAVKHFEYHRNCQTKSLKQVPLNADNLKHSFYI